MRLKEIVAEYLYLQDTDYKPAVLFKEQDSSVRNFYHIEASKILYRLISSYLTSRSNLHKVIDGAIKSFLDAHHLLTIENRSSLTKRVIKAIKNSSRVAEGVEK